MDYSRPDMADRLAAEYVMGTLHGAARRRFESLLPAHPTLRRAKADWERRLLQLSEVAPAVEPSPEVWQRVRARLFPEPTADTSATGTPSWWRRLGLWQGATAFASVAALSMAMLQMQPLPVRPPVVVVMTAPEGSAPAGLQSASFVASVSGDGRSLVLKPLHTGQAMTLNKALELWAVPAHGAPRSLGLVSAQQATTLVRASLLQDTAAFAVSVEPPGGSPAGAPTGPVISVGSLRL